MASAQHIAAFKPDAVGKHRRARNRSLVFPREHGAWGILLVPLLTGAWLGYQSGALAALLLFTTFALAIFLLRTPLEAWIGTAVVRARTANEASLARRAAAVYGLLALLAALGLFSKTPAWGLLILGAVAGACGILQAVIRRVFRRERVGAQVIGAVGLTATAPCAYYVASGVLNETAWMLWLLNWVFAAHQIHYVHLRIQASWVRSRRQKATLGAGFLVTQCMLLLVLLALALARPGPALWLLAFMPAALRTLAWFLQRPAALAVHRLGMAELGHTLLFAGLLIVSMRS